jgi:hypothetical protein
MNIQQIRKVTGALLIMGAVFVNIPYTFLIMNFDYPDILRQPTSEILTRFAAGGPGLVWTWLAFAWVGLPILLGILLLPQAFGDNTPADHHFNLGRVAMYFGAAGAVAQMIGLLRWPFVVPVLARMYTAVQATTDTRQAIEVVFQAVHQYGGVVLGEHIGQTFTILWMVLLSFYLLRKSVLPRWVAWMGFAASGVYTFAQGELLATAIPGIRYWGAAGLIGSLMWLGWLIALGIELIRSKESIVNEHTRQNSRRSVKALQ